MLRAGGSRHDPAPPPRRPSEPAPRAARRLAALLRPSTPAQFVITAFAVLVAGGTAALLVPPAHAGPGGAGPVEALFTAVSAVTVTGLVVVDTPTYWGPLGHVVILALIQVGGLGIMTSASLLGLLTFRRFGMAAGIGAVTEMRSISPGDVRQVLANVVRVSLGIEAAVALALALRLLVAYGASPGQALWQGVFHAVSAFNCAGFALWSDSLVRFRGDAFVLVPVTVAVLLGGFGFPVIFELVRNLRAAGARRPRRWSLNTLLVVGATAVILPIAYVALVALEWSSPATLGPLEPGQKLGTGLFETIVPRSAGLSTLDDSGLRTSSLIVLDVLMFVGSGPGGTAGGIKLTTAAVLLFVIVAEARGDEVVTAFRRRIPASVVSLSVSVSLLATGMVVLATLALTVIGRAPLDRTLFEVVSAFSTTGLSTGLSAQLPVAGQLLLAAVMLVGRLGPITVATALALRRRPRKRLYGFPSERPIIG